MANWCHWHDGADSDGPRHIGPGGFGFLTLENADVAVALSLLAAADLWRWMLAGSG